MSKPFPPDPPPPAAPHSVVPPVFDRVHVFHKARGQTVVTWELGRHFAEPLPYTFQLQVGRTGLPPYQPVTGFVRADDGWLNVGAPVVNNYLAYDTIPRLFGKTADVHYRVVLQSGLDVYYSPPANVYGDLGKRDYLISREIVRQENLLANRLVGVRGYLLKAYRYGPLCACVDPVTKEVTNSSHEVCYGTGYLGGYFPPLAWNYVDVTPESSREMLDPQRGVTKQQAVKGRMLAEPQVYALDVFVAKDSDQRYYVHPVSVAAQHRGVPLVINAELRLAPFTDVIYKFPVSG